MKRIGCNKEAVSTVLAYLFSFTIASMVMVSSVIITTNIIDDKTASVAGIEAQSLSNKVADALAEAVESKQSMPEASYQKTLDVPMDLAGKSYYIETTSTRVYVNTTDGAVSKSSTTYGTEDLNIGISGKVYSGSGELDLTSNNSEFVYKLDFGTGNSTDHSPVESGYYMVSDRSTVTQSLRNPPWWNLNYQYRIPIKVKNDASEDLDEVPVKIVLDTANFDYSNANVSVTSSSTVSSDLVFIDSGYGIVAEVETNPDTWYTWWLRDYLVGDIEIEVTITELSEGYSPSDIDGNSIKLNGVSCENWDGSIATFDPQEVLLSIGGGGSKKSKKSPTPGEYTITISGLLNDWTPFYGWDVVTVAYGDIFVDDDADPGWYDATHVQTIQEGIDSAGADDTVFVYNGNYIERVPITKRINLIGENRDTTIIDSNGLDSCVVAVGVDGVQIDSFTIRDNTERGILVTSDHVNITNCDVSNCCNGIVLYGASDCRIISCSLHDNSGDLGSGLGIYLYDSSQNNIIMNCICYDNDYDGIHIGNEEFAACNDNSIINCTCQNNDVGICIDASSNNKLINCSCEGSFEGIYIFQSPTTEITNCKCFGNLNYGIYIYESNDNTIENCEVYGNKIKGISLVGTVSDKCTNNLITNCEIYDNANQATADGDGIYLRYADQNTISNCVIYHNGDDGIHMSGESPNPAYNNTIVNCTIYDNGYYATEGGHGINFYLAGADSHPNVIDSCTIYNSTDEGIHLIASDYNVIKNCNVFDNGRDGIQILGSDENTITYCNLFNNGDDGIHLGKIAGINSKDNTIEYCNLYCNGGGTKWGVGIFTQGGSSSNYIHYNNFAEQKNNPAVTGWPKVYNAYDWTVIGNDWDNNYWDDYTGGAWHYIPASAADNNPNAGTITRELSGSYDNPDVILVDASYGFENWYQKKHIRDAVPNVRGSGVVMVYPGIYNSENIEIKNGTSLIGLDKDSVRVKGGGSGDVISVSTTQHNVLISSLNISDGDKGICIDTGGVIGPTNVITISDCKIHDNDEDGIYNDYPRVDIIDCEIYNNDWNGIYLASSYNEITNCAISENDYGIYFSSSSWNDLTNCDVHDNDYGIYTSDSSRNMIEYCDIYSNTQHGIYLSGSSNNYIVDYNSIRNNGYGIYLSGSSWNLIEDCDIYSNTQHGIYISDSSHHNWILFCDIYSNTQHGIYISDSNHSKILCDIHDNEDGIGLISSEYTDIMKCDIYSNTQYGIYISDSNNNFITSRNNIRDNNYGIYISGSDSSNNKIYHNNFENNNYSAYDAGSNTWYKSYGDPFNPLLDGGNHWDNYDEGYEGAYDFYSGPNQDILGSDGVVDTPTPYDFILGGSNQDGYPFGGGEHEVRPYYIDYWNPYGQSIILVNMSLKSYAFKYIYLYYGYDEPLDDLHNHSISEISVFSDDFNTDLSKWFTDGTDITIQDGYVSLSDSSTILDDPLIPPIPTIPEPGDPLQILYSKTVNESMYIVEAKMKILEGQGNMYFLQSGSSIGEQWDESYMAVVNVTPLAPSFLLYKNTKLTDERYIKMDDNLVPDLDHWIRIKSYIHLSKTCYKPDASTTYLENMTDINAYLYNYDTFADEGNVSGFENDADGILGNPSVCWGPYMSGYIGLGAGLMPSAGVSTVWVDWVRVMKTPIVPPTISIGSMESSTSNYGWTGTTPSSGNRETFDPFNPGPLLCDFNNGTTPATFVVNLPDDTYTITVTMGDKDAAHSPMYIKLGSTSTILLTIPETEPGEFETKWFTIDWTGGNLNLEFSGTNWAVNSMLIERSYKGIKIE